MVEPCADASDETTDRDAVWRICVCGMETVMIIRRGGWGEGGAAPGVEDSDSAVFGRRTELWP